VLITPSLGVPNWSVIYIINTAPSRAHGKLDIHRLTIYTDQMDTRPTTE
jgi:hypothetical protein